MDRLDSLLERAWQVRQAHFPPTLGAHDPVDTRSISLTGTACALDCAHCGRHYLEAMLPLANLAPDDARLEGASSLLLSGGCDARGRVPVTAHADRVRGLRPGRRLNWHVGLIAEEELRAIADLVDVVSFDLVGDSATIEEVYGLAATTADYRTTYRLLRRSVAVVPHVTVGLRGGALSGERAALRMLQEEGAEAIVFLVFVPTAGTRYAGRTPPPVQEVVRLLAEARLSFPTAPLLLGCMRPGGAYRRALDSMAVRAGINHIVKPHRAALEVAASLGLRVQPGRECCVLAGLRGVPGPAEVRVSAGTEVVLGLRQRPAAELPTAAYLLLDGGGCALACRFCAQARGSRARADALSRVVWPAHPLDAVLAGLERAVERLQRICVQVTVHHRAMAEVESLVRDLGQHTSLPISVAVRPANVEALGLLLGAGVEVAGLGLDCASERVYRQVKGTGWSSMIGLVEEACRHYPGRVRVHLMAGLGETEEELCRCMQQIYDWGGAVGLFAFTPVRGTPLQEQPQPARAVYRRMQAARYLLDRGLDRVERFRFVEERLVRFGRLDLLSLLSDGEAFRTSGCPGCNRPFYNERPGGTVYNYPRALRAEEIGQALDEMAVPMAE